MDQIIEQTNNRIENIETESKDTSIYFNQLENSFENFINISKKKLKLLNEDLFEYKKKLNRIKIESQVIIKSIQNKGKFGKNILKK